MCYVKPGAQLGAGKEGELAQEIRKFKTSIERRLDGMHSHLKSMGSTLEQLCAEASLQSTMLTELLLHNMDIPTLVVIVPLPEGTRAKGDSLLGSVKKWMAKPLDALLNKDARLFFVSEDSKRLADTNGGAGFEVRLTREWVKKAAPYLRIGMTVLRLAAQAARLATGVPVPVLLTEGMEEWLSCLQQEMEINIGNNAEGINAVVEKAVGRGKEVIKTMSMADEGTQSLPTSPSLVELPAAELQQVQKEMQELSRRVLDDLLVGKYGETWVKRSGLGKAVKDGRPVWCRPDEPTTGAEQSDADSKPPQSPAPGASAGALPDPAGQPLHIEQLMEAFGALQTKVEAALANVHPAQGASEPAAKRWEDGVTSRLNRGSSGGLLARRASHSAGTQDSRVALTRPPPAADAAHPLLDAAPRTPYQGLPKHSVGADGKFPPLAPQQPRPQTAGPSHRSALPPPERQRGFLRSASFTGSATENPLLPD